MADTSLACLDGELVATRDARIPVTDEGLLRGDGVFEVVRLYDGRPFVLRQHLERMARSAANLRLELEIAAVEADAEALLAAAEPGDAALRLVATRGGHRIALLEELPALRSPITLATITYAPTRVLDQIKSLSYAANMLASRLARERGFDEALLVTPHGRVLEAPTASFFYARDGELLTPPLDDHLLESITRAIIIEAAGAREAATTLDDVRGADEAFLASSIREVMVVGAVDDIALGTDGPLTARAAKAVRDRIEAELASAA